MMKTKYKKEVICRFNLKTGDVKFFDSLTSLSKFLKKTPQHTLKVIEDNQLVDNKYTFYYLDDLIKGKAQSTFRIKLPKRYIQKLIATEKALFTRALISQIKTYYPDNFKGTPVYVLNSEGEVEKILEGYEEVSNHFKIKTGTVKSRLSRIRNIDQAVKFGMCKKTLFDSFTSKTIK